MEGLSGTIKGPRGSPVKAPVKLLVGNTAYTTTVDGYYYLWLPPGTYKIQVHKQGYIPSVLSTKQAH
ncbi:unnamed protein product [Gongylonema pulchrum]|uniref:Carboxypeptidase-like regulatory domain-containing protein n=1 Tax=Gongylonema pulchrum TaxID=637853 RepID=A0A183DJ16_9BILA|nr:unnamed protein product [Gongylonema pulchrum]